MASWVNWYSSRLALCSLAKASLSPAQYWLSNCSSALRTARRKAPTLVASSYGMNFQFMPELHWRYGYAYVLALIAAVCLTLYVTFKRSKWL